MPTSYACHKINQDTTCKVLQHEAVQVETAKAMRGLLSTECASVFEYLALTLARGTPSLFGIKYAETSWTQIRFQGQWRESTLSQACIQESTSWYQLLVCQFQSISELVCRHLNKICDSKKSWKLFSLLSCRVSRRNFKSAIEIFTPNEGAPETHFYIKKKKFLKPFQNKGEYK